MVGKSLCVIYFKYICFVYRILVRSRAQKRAVRVDCDSRWILAQNWWWIVCRITLESTIGSAVLTAPNAMECSNTVDSQITHNLPYPVLFYGPPSRFLIKPMTLYYPITCTFFGYIAHDFRWASSKLPRLSKLVSRCANLKIATTFVDDEAAKALMQQGSAKEQHQLEGHCRYDLRLVDLPPTVRMQQGNLWSR